jgi:hypothetical protein
MPQTTGTNLSTRFQPMVAAQVAVSFRQPRDLYLVRQDDTVLLRPHAGRQFEKDFNKYEKKWKQETQYFSSPGDKYLHQSYARIIGMGIRL